MPLDKEQMRLADSVFMRGPIVLIEAGWDVEAINAFLENPEVNKYLQSLVLEFNHQDEAHARNRFGLRRGLRRLSSKAVDVYEKALDGPRYLRNNDGNVISGMSGPIVLDPEPTRNQVTVASEILDRLGVAPEGKMAISDKAVTDISVKGILSGSSGPKEVSVDEVTDPQAESTEAKALARERVRNVIEVLKERLPELRAKLLNPPAKTKGSKKKGVKKLKLKGGKVTVKVEE